MAEQSQGKAMQVDPELVRQLATLLDDTNLTEIEVQDGERRIKVARNITVGAAAPVYAAPAAAAPAPAAAAPAAAPEAAADHPGTVKSPMVGTVYLTPEPGAKPFASVGDKVAAGQTLLIVEAMKVMNAIPAPRAGTIKAVLVESGQPVEYDQPLVVVE
ncbi:acetyl-CoA carboxylase biotin carboxyl carrier protein [Sphingomonadaceae bacterium G21617-S1]|uniref:acetyl-CoA carboxylase biotin carboxyl carrier protein n=1 Tax=Rhizorhabdus sp. TaxID=1968843 RepID=UPI00120901EF|nr:acetyl-CoA carboxylase biotin carboxyl carrier protein [Rhizorhabdus sp.]MBD3760036.1 acetyl-CoA carboxylase biotin carboxyl carrier protein [Rhizorhabdus sp.]MCZ4344174.1 acetyl-CoA carboxylase biotin carboxyl carrier protein [Sphingomonadaceae bacterium G21617-S1]TAK12997.1 MAG: acetyl-CoA carboxylase biotin carboxyl carrier protein [Rhizorhabdus sp.]